MQGHTHATDRPTTILGRTQDGVMWVCVCADSVRVQGRTGPRCLLCIRGAPVDINEMSTLRASYVAGVDYEVSRRQNPNVKGKFGGNTYKRVVAGMQHDIERLESGLRATQQPRRVAPPEGYVYVLRASDKLDSVIKIGRTRDLIRRLREHSAALADDPHVLFTFRTDDAAAVETCVKGWLKDRKWVRGKYKEVYKADLDMVKQLVHGCDIAGKVKRVESKKTQQGGAHADPQLFIVIA